MFVESLGKEGSSGGKNARMDSGESVFNRQNVENTTVRPVAERGIWDVEI